MNWPLFTARRMATGDKGSFSRFIITIATTAIALSVGVMIIASSLFTGFDNTIKSKLFSFWGHIHIISIAQNQIMGDSAISINQPFYPKTAISDVSDIMVYASKAGIISTKATIEGIMLKGYGSDLNQNILKPFIEEGRSINVTDKYDARELLISKTTARRIQAKLNDTITLFFINGGGRTGRRFKIVGIYSTGMAEYDKQFAITDIRTIRKLNNWDSTEVAGFEVHLRNPDKMSEVSNQLNNQLPPELKAVTLKDIYPNIFEWLRLNARNELIIIILMGLVAIVNMITALLILIIERTKFIGIVKTLGSNNWQVMQVFIWSSLRIIFNGLFFGNAIGFAICLIQKYGHFVKLNPDSYYVTYAPVDFNYLFILCLNIGTLVLCMLFLFLPVLIVLRITPIKALRWA